MGSSEGRIPARRDRRGSVLAPNRPAGSSLPLVLASARGLRAVCESASGQASNAFTHPAGHNMQLRVAARPRPTQCKAARYEGETPVAQAEGWQVLRCRSGRGSVYFGRRGTLAVIEAVWACDAQPIAAPPYQAAGRALERQGGQSVAFQLTSNPNVAPRCLLIGDTAPALSTRLTLSSGAEPRPDIWGVFLQCPGRTAMLMEVVSHPACCL